MVLDMCMCVYIYNIFRANFGSDSNIVRLHLHRISVVVLKSCSSTCPKEADTSYVLCQSAS